MVTSLLESFEKVRSQESESRRMQMANQWGPALLVALTVAVGIFTNDQRLNQLERSLTKRMDELKELWRSELRRVEEVLDARLKHIEEILKVRP
jgi:DnaJ-domain-containing protein 1